MQHNCFEKRYNSVPARLATDQELKCCCIEVFCTNTKKTFGNLFHS